MAAEDPGSNPNLGKNFYEQIDMVAIAPVLTCPRATQQGRVKCKPHVTVPAVPTQEAIPEEGRQISTIRDRHRHPTST